MMNNDENNIIKREKYEADEESRAAVVNETERQDDLPVSTRTRRLSGNSATGLVSVEAKPSIAKITIKQRNMIDGAITTNSKIITRNSSNNNNNNNMEQLTNGRHGQPSNSQEGPTLPPAQTLAEVTEIYLRDPSERSEEDSRILSEYSFLIPEIKARIKHRLDKEILKQRVMEFEDPMEVIEEKANTLVNLIRSSRHIVIYTGAGISTSASIPDYRGPNGLWTQIRRAGTFSITKLLDLSQSEPTYTHMAIRELCKKRLVKHVVSQNCDGLHLRSGMAQQQLSEIHGDMYIEVCPTCERQYFRQADVTERTSRFRHKTGRKCHSCAEPNNNLIDTIVLYGERSRTKWPMNWERASKAAKRADLIICMGSSLKTLRRYGCLWPKTIGNSSSRKEPETKLVIINLQYTPKDKMAVLKINGKCDLVMQLVMQRLKIEVPSYDWTLDDPLLRVAVPFTQQERSNLNRNLIFETIRKRPAPADNHDDDHGDGDQSSSSSPNKRAKSEPRCSPSLFVSELTDDPDKNGLRMRIRAVNVDATGSNELNASHQTGDDEDSAADMSINNNDDNYSIDECSEEEYNENARLENNSQNHEQRQQPPPPPTQNKDNNHPQLQLQTNKDKQVPMNNNNKPLEYVLPGWLGKSIGSAKSSSYRRKRHGNKGRKHSSSHQLKASQPQQQPPQEQQQSSPSPSPKHQHQHHPPPSAMVEVASQVI